MDLIEQIVAEYNGNASLAILRIAHRYGIGIGYVSRSQVDGYLTGFELDELTDEEWEKLRPAFSGGQYDDFLCEEYAEAESEYIKQKLMQVGIQRDICACRSVMLRNPPSPPPIYGEEQPE